MQSSDIVMVFPTFSGPYLYSRMYPGHALFRRQAFLKNYTIGCVIHHV